MKQLRVDFVASRAWRGIWAAAGLVALVIAVRGVATWWPLHQTWRAEQVKLSQLQKQLGQTRPADPASPSAKTLQAHKIAQTLQFDLNKIFKLIEALNLPKVQLKNFIVDMPGDAIRLEYEFDSLATASTITQSLNAGYDNPPWRMADVSAIDASNLGAVANTATVGSTGATYRGSWIGSIGKL